MVCINYGCSSLDNSGPGMDLCLQKNYFTLPAYIGDGYIRYFFLADGLQCLVADYRSTRDICLNQKGWNEEYFNLRFTEYVPLNNMMDGKEDTGEANGKKAYVLLTSSLFDFSYMISKGSAIRSVNISIPKRWLFERIAIENAEVILKRYLMAKKSRYDFASFDNRSCTLFNQIMNRSKEKHFSSETVENMLMLLVQNFLSNLMPNLDVILEKDKIKISASEVRRLMAVETCLSKDFSMPPPSIPYLSRIAAMSTTSLKNKFKKMYGRSLYEYFQKNRMQRAKVLLLTHKYSIKEIGSQLGYSNLSNFSIAFKKQFSRLPSQFIVNINNPEKAKLAR